MIGDWPLHDIPSPPTASGIVTDLPAAAAVTLLLGLLCEELGVQSMAAATAGRSTAVVIHLFPDCGVGAVITGANIFALTLGLLLVGDCLDPPSPACVRHMARRNLDIA